MQLITADRQQIEYRTMGPSGALPWGDSTPPTNQMLGGGSAAGVQVTERTALQIDAVFGSCRVIAGGVSTLPVHEYQGFGGPKDRRLPPTAMSPLVEEPFSEIDSMDFLTQFTMGLALAGNFYGLIISRDKNLYASQIMPMNPGNVRVRRLTYGENAGRLEYRFNGDVVPTGDVVHVPNLTLSGNPVGLNPVDYMRHVFGNAHAMDLWSGALMSNSAMPMGVITMPGDYDEVEVLAMAQAWKQAHQGISASALPGFLSGGATFQQVSITPEAAQYLQSKQYAASVISGTIFGVPPHMIGIVDRTTSWGTGIQQQEMGFVTNTLSNYIRRYERMISKLLPPDRYIRLDLSERLRGDTLQRFQAWALALGAGWLNKDEVRAQEHYPPIPDGLGQKFYEPVTMAPLGQMGVGGPTTGAGPGGMSLLPNPFAPDGGAAKSPSGQ